MERFANLGQVMAGDFDAVFLEREHHVLGKLVVAKPVSVIIFVALHMQGMLFSSADAICSTRAEDGRDLMIMIQLPSQNRNQQISNNTLKKCCMP